MLKTISYQHIAHALTFYQARGYYYIEVPWAVKKQSLEITKPPNVGFYETALGCLVASGEQSLLDIRKSLVENTKYVCATPCFRDEPHVSEVNRNYFFKVELMVAYAKHPEYSLMEMVETAESFFRQYVLRNNDRRRVPTEEGIDLYIGDMEIGSYGIRQHKDFKWVYGTGCAEPRFSQAMEKLDAK